MRSTRWRSMRSARTSRGSLAAKPDEEPPPAAAERSGEDQQRDERHPIEPYSQVRPAASISVAGRAISATTVSLPSSPTVPARGVERALGLLRPRSVGQDAGDPILLLSVLRSDQRDFVREDDDRVLVPDHDGLVGLEEPSMHVGGDAGGVGALHRSAQVFGRQARADPAGCRLRRAHGLRRGLLARRARAKEAEGRRAGKRGARTTSSQRCPRRGTPRVTEPSTYARMWVVPCIGRLAGGREPFAGSGTTGPLSGGATMDVERRSADGLGLRAGLHLLAVPAQRRDRKALRQHGGSPCS